MGIGAVSIATLSEMHHLKDLGIHPEMFAAGILDLIEKVLLMV
jgi:acyl-CoA hydrolase